MSFKALHDALGGFRSWFRIDSPLLGEVYVCVPPKCAWTSFRMAIAPHTIYRGATFADYMSEQGRGPFAPHQILHRKGRKILSVRDPLSRYVSIVKAVMGTPGFANKQMLPAEYRNGQRLIEYIERSPMGNVHWYPQAGYHVAGCELVDYRDVNARLGLPECWENRGPDVGVLEIPAERVLSHYRADHDMHLRMLAE